MTDTRVNVEHAQALIEASLTAAWLRTCGPSGTPGDWMIPGSFVEVMEAGCEFEVEVYPLYSKQGEHGRSWSSHMDPATSEEAWEWRLGVGWNDFGENPDAEDQAVIDAVEELGGCWDERCVSWMAPGSHQEKPAVPDGLAEAFVRLTEGLKGCADPWR